MDTDESKESSDTTPVTEESSASPINRTKQAADSALGTSQAAGLLAENFDQNTRPSPIHCLGARAYDGGYFDVGSFFVFRHKPSDVRRGDEVAGFPVGEDRAPISSADHSSEQAPSPLGYVLLDGLTVKTHGAEKKQVEGSGSGGALRAFLELQRQVRNGKRSSPLSRRGHFVELISSEEAVTANNVERVPPYEYIAVLCSTLVLQY